MRNLVSVSLSLLLSSSSALPSADLPVKKVTLYKHGIGYFERAGAVPAGEEVRLDFKSNDMNDVLKSLIVVDADGGKISGIRYDSNATLDQQLEKYPFTIGSQEMVSTFLDRLKGAHLEVTIGRCQADRRDSGRSRHHRRWTKSRSPQRTTHTAAR